MKKITKLFLVFILAIAGIGALSACSKQDSKSYDPGKTVKKTLTTKTFSRIKANLEISDVTIRSGKSFKVLYHGGSKLKPEVKINNGTLIIDQKKKMPSTISTSATKLTIIIPAGKLNNLSVENDAGDISIIKANVVRKAKLEADSGDINITNSKIARADIETDSDDINISHTPFDGYDLEADSGDIDFFDKNVENGSFKKNAHAQHLLKAESDSGDITIQ